MLMCVAKYFLVFFAKKKGKVVFPEFETLQNEEISLFLWQHQSSWLGSYSSVLCHRKNLLDVYHLCYGRSCSLSLQQVQNEKFDPQLLHGQELFVNVINPTNSGRNANFINFILFLFQHSKAVHNVDSVNEIDFIN